MLRNRTICSTLKFGLKTVRPDGRASKVAISKPNHQALSSHHTVSQYICSDVVVFHRALSIINWRAAFPRRKSGQKSTLSNVTIRHQISGFFFDYKLGSWHICVKQYADPVDAALILHLCEKSHISSPRVITRSKPSHVSVKTVNRTHRNRASVMMVKSTLCET